MNGLPSLYSFVLLHDDCCLSLFVCLFVLSLLLGGP